MAMEETRLFFDSPAEWRSWLEENHDEASGIWVAIRKKNGNKGIAYEDALNEALAFGWIDNTSHAFDDNVYLIHYSPRKPGSNWSKSNRERAEKLIEQRRMAEPGMAAIEKARQNGAWEKAYAGDKFMEIPRDLEAAMAKNPVASANFGKFAPTYRNMFLRWLESAEGDKRKQRIEEIVKRAEKNIKVRYGKI